MKKLLLAILLLGCGPITKVPPRHFYVVVHNADTQYPESVECSWWFGSTIVGDVKTVMPPGGEVTFDLGEVCPDGFELDTVAWSITYSLPEYSDCWVYNVIFPMHTTYKTYMKK